MQELSFLFSLSFSFAQRLKLKSINQKTNNSNVPNDSGAVGQVRPVSVSALCVDSFLVYLQFIPADSCTHVNLPTDCSESYFTYLLTPHNISYGIFLTFRRIFKPNMRRTPISKGQLTFWKYLLLKLHKKTQHVSFILSFIWYKYVT
jgi:putative component of membrane protein insertase Oxa1/YidC/SpoIIIJ protein YidD